MPNSLAAKILILAILPVLTFSLGLSLRDAHAFKEAPSLAEKAKAGELPPVDKRLPETPVVVTPLDRPGKYGGVWRRAYTGLSDLVGARRIVYDPLVRWSTDYKIVPNVASKWEVLEDGSVFVFHLVKGIRWSDGAPFTADDILFYLEDILQDKELTPSIPQWLAPGGVPPKVSKLDDFTIRLEFSEPYSIFLERLACPDGMALVSKPKHFLKKFHKKYADPKELEALMTQKKAATWGKLFQDASDVRHGMFTDKDMPSICAWITKVPAPAKRFVMERNPYYWKVDTEGNQLPYIDSIVHDLQAESQTILLKAIAGEIDMEARHLGGMQSSVLLLANVAEGKYKLIPKISTASVGLLLAPNLNHKDPAMKKILSDPKFRIALSHMINRQEINKIVYRGKGVPRQAAPLKQSHFYDPNYENAYMDFDQGKAGALLDEIGLKMGARGKRHRPDGQPFKLTLDVVVANQSWVDQAEIVASNLKSMGIDTEVKAETRELFLQRTQGASHDIALWTGDGGIECLLDPRWYFPYSSESLNAPLYGQWFQGGGKKGEEPPAEIKELMDIYNQILKTVPEEKKKELFGKIIAANKKNLWVIGLVHDPPDYYVVAKNMFNVPKKDFQSWMYPNPGPANPEQFFYDSAK